MAEVRRRGRTIAIAALAVVATVAVAGGAVATITGGEDGWRTATVTSADVDQTIAATGTVASVSRSDVAFSTDGTVASVAVGVGDTVSAGQTLAALDADALQDAVDDAEEALADAQQTLADDLEAQSDGDTVDSIVSGGTGSGGGVAGFSAGARFAPAAVATETTQSPEWDAVDVAEADVEAAQQALLDQYDVVDGLLATGSGSADASTSVCATFLAAELGDDTGEDTDGGTAEGEDDGGTDGAASDLTAIKDALTQCQESVATTLTDLQDTLAAQTALLQLASGLDDKVTVLHDAVATARAADAGSEDPTETPTEDPTEQPTQTPGQTPSGSPSEAATGAGEQPSGSGEQPGTGEQTEQPSGSATASGGGSGTTGGTGADTAVDVADVAGTGGSDSGVTVSAERILADRAAVGVAEADLAIAQAAAEAGTLTSPIDGTVAQVALAVGDEVTAGSDSAVVTILGDEGFLVATTMDLADVMVLEVGQAVTGTIGGYDGEVTGEVATIGLTDVSETLSPQFTVEIAVADPTVGLFEGASARVEVTVAERTGVLTVPTSAVSVAGATATVSVLGDDGEPSDVEVTTGAVGAELTEITEGLSEGQQVVLADLDAELETEDDTSSGLSGLGGDSDMSSGGFDGGGFGGGQPPGGTGGFGGGGSGG